MKKFRDLIEAPLPKQERQNIAKFRLTGKVDYIPGRRSYKVRQNKSSAKVKTGGSRNV